MVCFIPVFCQNNWKECCKVTLTQSKRDDIYLIFTNTTSIAKYTVLLFADASLACCCSQLSTCQEVLVFVILDDFCR